MRMLRSKLLCLALSLATLLAMGGCGGGGGNTPAPVAKATISGAISFPAIDSIVAKRAGKVVVDNDVTVQAYTIDGKAVGTAVHPTYDDEAEDTTRVYPYSIANLEPGVDYVIKVTKAGSTLKKLIEKKDVTGGTLVGQNLGAVSTAAVIVASQNLGVTLGDTFTGKTVSDISSKISTDIKPVLLEGTIISAISGGKSSLTPETALYANLYNVVVSAVIDNKEPAEVAVGTTPLTNPPNIFIFADGLITKKAFSSAALADITPTYTAPTETAATYTKMAKVYLAKQDISNAALNYEKALVIDSSDAEANFGGAITSGIMLMEDPDVQSIITKWGAVLPTVNQVVQGTSPIKLPFGNMTSIKLAPKTTAKGVASTSTATTTQNVLTAFSALKAKLPQQRKGFKSVAKELGLVPATAPSIGEMQTLIDNVIIPRIDKVIARLAKAETDTFSFTITKAMQGSPINGADVTLDSGEMYTLDAALNIFQVLFKIAGSYHFDIPAGYTYDTIGQDPLALINNSTTFTLNAGGAARMAGALDNAKSAAAKAKLAYDKVVIRDAGVGMFDLKSWTTLQKDDFVANQAKVTAALAGQYDILDSLGAKIVTINATKFFTNPLTRANLPTFGYDVPRDATLSQKYDNAVAVERNFQTGWNMSTNTPVYTTGAVYCDIVPKTDLPDYTLNGILPGNTSANNVAKFNGVLPVLSGKLLSVAVNYNSKSYTTNNGMIYYLSQNGATAGGYAYEIMKIDPVTGTVSQYLSGLNTPVWVERLVFHNGKYYLVSGGSFYAVSAAGVVGTSPEFNIYSGSNWVSAIASNGANLYFVVNKWDPLTYSDTSEIHSYINGDDALMFTISDYVSNIAIDNASIYVNANDTEKRSADGTVVARYILTSGEWNVLLDGYFYSIGDWKIIKTAGSPAGGVAAKAALAKQFGF